MSSSIELQKQIKDNAEDVRRFVSDLSQWEEEMKHKEAETRTTSGSSKESVVPPVRNISKKRDSSDTSEGCSSSESQKAKKRISSSDYSAWEKFDVEEACNEIDSLPNETIGDTEEEKKFKEKRLRDEANVEKEKGNAFVKKEKWDNAIECYSKAIKCYPRDAIYYCNRAHCYLKKKNYRAAETDCTSALALDNTYVKALHRRGLARKELNQLDEARSDLKRATEIEPNNTAILRDYNTVRQTAEVNEVVVTELVEQISRGTLSEADIILDVEKKTPILPAKKHRPSGASEKELVGKKELSRFTAWPKLDDCVVVEPVIKPPHKRSKKPLKRIPIQEDGDIAVATISGEPNLPVQSASEFNVNQEKPVMKKTQSKKIEEISSSNSSEDTTVHVKRLLAQSNKKTDTPRNILSLDVPSSASPKVVPPVPKNSVQFLAGWRQISMDSKMCFQFLKQINGEDFPKIFQDSLDGNILSQILNVLATEFVSANEPVLSYIQGLTHVKRFRTLTLFLSRSDKNNMDELLKYTQSLEKTSPETVSILKEEYEL